jgi:signal transduction histidine kinase
MTSAGVPYFRRPRRNVVIVHVSEGDDPERRARQIERSTIGFSWIGAMRSTAAAIGSAARFCYDTPYRADRADRSALAGAEALPERRKRSFEMEHNWRTSVTAIRAAAEILRDYDDLAAAERHRFLDAIVEESARLHRTFERPAEAGQ